MKNSLVTMRKTTQVLAALALATGLGACGGNRTDAEITSDVRQELAEAKIPGRIEVASAAGVVTLSGIVPDAVSRDRAAEAADDVRGVDKVVNQIQPAAAAARPVTPPTPPPAP